MLGRKGTIISLKMWSCALHMTTFDGKYDWIDQAWMFYTQKWSLRGNLAPKKKEEKDLRMKVIQWVNLQGGARFFPFWLLLISIFVEYFGQFCWIFIFYQKKKNNCRTIVSISIIIFF